MHMGACDGKGHWGTGHAPDSDVTLIIDYATIEQAGGNPAPQEAIQGTTE